MTMLRLDNCPSLGINAFAVMIPLDTTLPAVTNPTKVEIPQTDTVVNVENPVVLTPATPPSIPVKLAP